MISLEIAKLIQVLTAHASHARILTLTQGRWIEWDIEMALDPTRPEQTGAKARSTDQNDELGAACARYPRDTRAHVSQVASIGFSATKPEL